ncbi:MAG: hypothetical protein E6G98_01565 [Bacillati bacterium ANGP1]|uniref:EfeO-type cupredoxin-like domain-containing protein n=1 Tax=Candidatus Segetimicrobium genomatis TaxID=2569760 RepID=A0A537LY97_9BACT|nr:MAG: hypothetical protein E6G98_01565 [Terrabacteria group bacterium ANGP1]
MAMRRGIWLGVLVVLVAAFVAACGGGGQQGGGQPAGTPEGSAVTVSEKEWTIQFASSTVKPGKVKLLIKNEGTIEHNFVIEGTSVDLEAIPPGSTKEVTVDLKPGTYNVLCTIAGHSEAGMKTTITVAQ